MAAKVVPTTPYQDQKPGTSGLRKKCKVFCEGNYLANFFQSIFDSLPEEEVKGATLLVSGDGRYYNKTAIHVCYNIAFANGVKRVLVGRDGLMSTPAASCVIREREGGVCSGGIILTASHNPGGPSNDFGVKYNCKNGEPAPESLTNKIFERSKVLTEYKTYEFPAVDLSKEGVHNVSENHTVEVISPTEDWMKLMGRIFDWDSIRSFLKRKDFKFVYDGMHGVGGPYGRAVFVDTLGAPESCLVQCQPSEDFGGGHPDPNLTYAEELVKIMSPLDKSKVTAETPDFGASSDGDADRNMILGKGFFVTPSDSLAIICAHAAEAVPYFKTNGVKGVARSLPTSCAVDSVAKKLGVPQYETPTGWKFFGNLMDSGKISICGEESFGTGSDHVREKDGIWAVLVWLSILAVKNKDVPEGKLVTIEQIVTEHWKKFGRNFYCRYDYEEVDATKARAVMDRLENLIPKVTKLKDALSAEGKTILNRLPALIVADNFTYKDPVDGSVSANQGIRFVFADGSRIVWRLSGTGSVGATVRVYYEKFEGEAQHLLEESSAVLKDFVALSLEMSEMEKLTGRTSPTVIT